jgi:hypothetical protein
MAHLAFLVVLGIISFGPTNCNSARVTRMHKFPMGALTTTGNKLEAFGAKVLKELTDLSRHGRILGPCLESCKEQKMISEPHAHVPEAEICRSRISVMRVKSASDGESLDLGERLKMIESSDAAARRSGPSAKTPETS